MSLERIEVQDLRAIESARVELSPGLNIFVGRNAQGKTSLLEAVGLVARGRSFRTEATRTLIRRGAPSLIACGTLALPEATRLEVAVTSSGRRLAVDGQEVAAAAFGSHVPVVVYATERLRVIHGSMRERRLFLDRTGAALWPLYRRLLRDLGRIVEQRNAALRHGSPGLEAWDERLIEAGAQLRQRRGELVRRLSAVLERRLWGQEHYRIALEPALQVNLAEERSALAAELLAARRAERRAGITLVGPQRDRVRVTIDGHEAAQGASAGQVRSTLLALCLAVAEVHREERGARATLLLDDLDSELDEERARRLCEVLAADGQAFITTAHPGWAGRLDGLARRFVVEAGTVRPA